MKLKIIMRISEIIKTRSFYNGFSEGYDIGYTDGKSDTTMKVIVKDK